MKKSTPVTRTNLSKQTTEEDKYLEREKAISSLFAEQFVALKSMREDQVKCLALSTKINTFILDDDKRVKFNVGGQYFETKAKTLNNEKETFFTAMFSEQFNTKPGEDGAHFIDRDPTYFRFILKYLRDPGDVTQWIDGLKSHLDEFQMSELEAEVAFYGLLGFSAEIAKVSSPCSAVGNFGLITGNEATQLETWIGKKGAWTLLYQATKNGFASANFHPCCDNKGATVCIIKTTNGSIFGGYAAGHWHSSGTYEWYGGKNFIFSAYRAGQTRQMVKFDNNGSQCGNANGIVGITCRLIY
jgi:hypothetical protein